MDAQTIESHIGVEGARIDGHNAEPSTAGAKYTEIILDVNGLPIHIQIHAELQQPWHAQRCTHLRAQPPAQTAPSITSVPPHPTH